MPVQEGDVPKSLSLFCCGQILGISTAYERLKASLEDPGMKALRTGDDPLNSQYVLCQYAMSLCSLCVGRARPFFSKGNGSMSKCRVLHLERLGTFNEDHTPHQDAHMDSREKVKQRLRTSCATWSVEASLTDLTVAGAILVDTVCAILLSGLWEAI